MYDEMKKKCEKFGDACKITKTDGGCKIVLSATGSSIADLNDSLKKLKTLIKGKVCDNMKFSNGKLTCYCS